MGYTIADTSQSNMAAEPDATTFLDDVLPEADAAAACRRPPFVLGLLQTIAEQPADGRLDLGKVDLEKASETLHAPHASAVMAALSQTLDVAQKTFELSDAGDEYLRRDRAPVIMTGGAFGADTLWAEAAPPGVPVTAVSFEGHTVHMQDLYSRVIRLSKRKCSEIAMSVPFREACRILNKTASKEYTVRLIARNFELAAKADVLLAVSQRPPASTHGKAVGVEGGTGWTCQFFVAHNTAVGPLNMYCTTTTFAQWYRCYRDSASCLYWKECEPPTALRGRIGCVGTRDITAAARPTMKRVLKTATS